MDCSSRFHLEAQGHCRFIPSRFVSQTTKAAMLFHCFCICTMLKEDWSIHFVGGESLSTFESFDGNLSPDLMLTLIPGLDVRISTCRDDSIQLKEI